MPADEHSPDGAARTPEEGGIGGSRAGGDDPGAAMGVGAAETAYLAARTARDHLDVALARGEPHASEAIEPLRRAAREAKDRLVATLERLEAEVRAGRPPPPEDRRAVDAMRRGLEQWLAVEPDLPTDEPGAPGANAIDPASCEDGAAWLAATETGGASLRRRLEACFGRLADDLRLGDERVTRPVVLARLATEPDPARRRRLLLALEPLWRAVDGGGVPPRPSPYRALLRESASAWAGGRSPVEANAQALGVTGSTVEGWARATLETWRAAVVEPGRSSGEFPIEPWDWWWAAGAAERALAPVLALDRLQAVNRAVHAALGADLDRLRVRFDTAPRPTRPPVPVAYTTFGARPGRTPAGAWSVGEPTVLASYTLGGLGELTELVHETGHAIHIAAIRTRPAFADWPDSDAFTEALAELVALDLVEPAWLRRWLPRADPLPASTTLRARYADVALDAAWALLEILLHRDPDRAPSDVWTELTSSYLGIAPHPEWSWWALRGQLVTDPGYMANYAIGAVIAEDLRAAIRAARGDWIAGDPGWYGWVSERLYRFGLERSAGDVLRDVLGRPPTVDPLIGQLERIAGSRA
jgi:hypothetical protein